MAKEKKEKVAQEIKPPVTEPETELVEITNVEAHTSAAVKQEERSEPYPFPISIVIPYLSEKVQGEELIFAVASIQKNFKDPHQIIVIGDREEWFEEKGVLHISHLCESDNPQIDVLHKMRLAVASEIITEKFIWTNDDIYFVSPVITADIEVLKCSGELDTARFGGKYAENIQNTIALLDKHQLPKYNYGTHMPVVFEKEKLSCLLDFIKEKNKGSLISSLYFNTQFPDFIPIQLDWRTDNWCLPVLSPDPDPEKFRKLVARKKFLNNAESGYSPFLVRELKNLFAEEEEED